MAYCKIQPLLPTALVRESGGRGVCFTSFLPGILLLQGHVLSVPVAPSFLFTLSLSSSLSPQSTAGGRLAVSNVLD